MSTVKVYDNIPTTYSEAAAALDRGCTVKLGHETELRRTPGDIGGAINLRYYDTEVVTYHQSGLIIATDGGWDTVTTKRRIRAALANAWAAIECRPDGWRGTYWIAASQDRISADRWDTVARIVRPLLDDEMLRPGGCDLPFLAGNLFDSAQYVDATALEIAVSIATTADDNPHRYPLYYDAALACVA